MNEHLLGIDIGTSGCKLLVIDLDGNVVQQSGKEYPLFAPEPMWSEQDPESWWDAVRSCLSSMNLSQVIAIGVTGQMHGSVFLDSDHKVIRRALLWNDQRTIHEVAQMQETLGLDTIYEHTANPPMTGFQVPKLLWLKAHEPEHFKQVAHVLLPKDFIRLKLTGELATEVSDASGTGVFDVRHRIWSESMLKLLGLDAELFPKCFESDEVTGSTYQVPGLRDGIPVVGGAGDQAAAAVGTGAVQEGVISISLGTSGVIFTSIPTPHVDRTGALHTFCHANRSWHTMGVMLSCGGALRWYRDTIGGGRSYDQISDSARRAELGSQGLVFLPYLTGERCPHTDPSLRASFQHLTLAHHQADLDRALFEGVTFGLMDCLSSVRSVGATASTVRVTGGGAKSDFWVQMIADVLECTCERLAVDEGPAYGAAILAGVGVGRFNSVESACASMVKTAGSVPQSRETYRSAYEHFLASFVKHR